MIFEPAFIAYAEHKEAIERFINELIQTSNPNNLLTQHAVANAVGLDTNLLTEEELDYINSECTRRML